MLLVSLYESNIKPPNPQRGLEYKQQIIHQKLFVFALSLPFGEVFVLVFIRSSFYTCWYHLLLLIYVEVICKVMLCLQNNDIVIILNMALIL